MERLLCIIEALNVRDMQCWGQTGLEVFEGILARENEGMGDNGGNVSLEWVG